MVLGLTGGIGMGKSTAARIFSELGWKVVDSDQVIRDQVLTDPEVIAEVRGKFGSSVLGLDGRIDRGQLARVVFADLQALRALEELTHPRLFAHWRKCLAEQPRGPWVFDVPLLFEKGLENWFDFTVCVATTSAQQLARLAERGLSPALAEQRILKQLPLVQKIEFADFVLLNDGSPEFLREQITRLVTKLGIRL